MRLGGGAAKRLDRARKAEVERAAEAHCRSMLSTPHRKLVKSLFELQDADDWLGVAALEEEALALVRETGVEHPRLVTAIHGILGLGFAGIGKYGRALEFHTTNKAMYEELGDSKGVAKAWGNMGNCYHSMLDYSRAREMYNKDREMCESLGDREGVVRASCNLGCCYDSTGDYRQALEMYETAKTMYEEMGHRVGLAGVHGNIGNCYLHMGNYDEAMSHYKEHYTMAEELNLEQGKANAALGIGVTFRLQVKDAGAGGDGVVVRQVEDWLKIGLNLGHTMARLHLAYLAFDAGQEEKALAYLHDYLHNCVENARNRCHGCWKTRGEDAPMLTCGGCHVVRFCSREHQKIASNRVTSGGCLFKGRHKDVCPLLGKWRQQVVKEGMSPDVLRADALAFLGM
tara:strand:+ start:1529 stop:2728 length:1200 start_codon:yes stop_codon:yes gene_type:complete